MYKLIQSRTQNEGVREGPKYTINPVQLTGEFVPEILISKPKDKATISKLKEAFKSDFIENKDSITLKNVYLSEKGVPSNITKIVYHLTYGCNIKCEHCGMNYDKIGEIEEKGYMPFELFKNIIDQTAENNQRTDFYGGEPLTNVPRLTKMADYAVNQIKEKSIHWPNNTWIRVITNFVNVPYEKEKMAEFLQKFPKELFWQISIGYFHQKEFARIAEDIRQGKDGKIKDLVPTNTKPGWELVEKVRTLDKLSKELGIEYTVLKADPRIYKYEREGIDIKDFKLKNMAESHNGFVLYGAHVPIIKAGRAENLRGAIDSSHEKDWDGLKLIITRDGTIYTATPQALSLEESCGFLLEDIKIP